jgi:hypothetical protein
MFVMFTYPWITGRTAVFQSENHNHPQCGLRFSNQPQNRKFAVAVLVFRGYPWVCRSLGMRGNEGGRRSGECTWKKFGVMAG